MTQYATDVKEWKGKNIPSKDHATAILMGVEPESWLRYLKFCEKNGGKYFNQLSVEDEKELSFVEEYRCFLRDYFKFIPEIARHARLREYFQGMQKCGKWCGNLKQYAQELYDNGVLFSPEIEKYFKLSYSPDSWVVRFHEEWRDKQAWTLAEAVRLFEGKELTQLRPTPGSPIIEILIDQANRDVKRGILKRFPDSNLYPPCDIVLWLRKRIKKKPALVLLSVLGIQADTGRILSRAEKVRQCAEHIVPRFINEYHEKYRREPKKRDVVIYLSQLPEFEDIKATTIEKNFNLSKMKKEASKLRARKSI